MAQQLGSKQPVDLRAAAVRGAAWAAAAALAGAAACATGVDVSDSELEEICASPGVVCGEAPPPSGGSGGLGPVGSSGSGSNPVATSGSGGTFNATGGSTSGASGTSGTGTGTGGSAGTSSPTLQPLARGTCMAEDDVVIVYTDRGMGTTTNQATMVLHVQNDGPTFDLTDLTIRYWFTDDGLSDFTSDIDYASQGTGANTTSAVTRTFGEELGSNYVSLGFSSGGPVGPEGVDTIQMRLHASNYQTLELSNDFSFQGGANAIPNRNITPYVNGVQVGGCVPIPP